MEKNIIIDQYLKQALAEDIKEGDHTSLACIPKDAYGSARLICKDEGIIAGVEITKRLFHLFDSEMQMDIFIQDGQKIRKGDIAFQVKAKSLSILQTERLALNILQRMSGIASKTNLYAEKIKGYPSKILDTRKTTPNNRLIEKEAVRIGGGYNHRMGLYDMIMIKDNHIDFAGGIEAALHKTKDYLKRNRLDLYIVIEARSFEEIHEIIKTGIANRILIDNFTPAEMKKAVALIGSQFETEASGGIDYDSIEEYAATGVNYISIGALTHQINSLDMSLKAD